MPPLPIFVRQNRIYPKRSIHSITDMSLEQRFSDNDKNSIATGTVSNAPELLHVEIRDHMCQMENIEDQCHTVIASHQVFF